jgi:serine/threonine protein kinase
VTELAERGSLYDVLKNKDIHITYDMQQKFAIDAAKGMLYLHTCVPPVIHRDLKV